MSSTRSARASLLAPILAALLGSACGGSDDGGHRRLRLIAEGDDCAVVTQVCVSPSGGDTECFPACDDGGGDDIAEPPPGYDCVDVGEPGVSEPGDPGDRPTDDGQEGGGGERDADQGLFEFCYPTGCDVSVSPSGDAIDGVDCDDGPGGIDGGTVCPEIWAPVCADGVTYSSACVAEANGANDYVAGECT
jgi:hypothetical protein